MNTISKYIHILDYINTKYDTVYEISKKRKAITSSSNKSLDEINKSKGLKLFYFDDFECYALNQKSANKKYKKFKNKI